jgi:hypothetical protein
VEFARARQFVRAVAAHDFDAAEELLDPAVETVTPRGTLRGIAACRQVLQKASGDEQLAMRRLPGPNTGAQLRIGAPGHHHDPHDSLVVERQAHRKITLMEQAEPEFEDVDGEVLARTHEIARWRETGEVAYDERKRVFTAADAARIANVRPARPGWSWPKNPKKHMSSEGSTTKTKSTDPLDVTEAGPSDLESSRRTRTSITSATRAGSSRRTPTAPR